MKKILFIVVSIFSLSAFSQNDVFEENIKKMLRVQGVEQNWVTVITKMIELQKNSYPEIDESYWEMFEVQLIDSSFYQLYKLFIPIYKKYLTNEEVEAIISFYESDAGKSFVAKTPLILEESMEVGARYGEELGRYIIGEIEKIKNNNMLTNFDGCESIKTGKFKSVLPDNTEMEIERDEKYQYEYYLNTTTKYKIEWKDDCRYTLEIIKTDSESMKSMKSMKGNILIVNIYEVNENYYKYVCTTGDNNFTMDGIIYKIK